MLGSAVICVAIAIRDGPLRERRDQRMGGRWTSYEGQESGHEIGDLLKATRTKRCEVNKAGGRCARGDKRSLMCQKSSLEFGPAGEK